MTREIEVSNPDKEPVASTTTSKYFWNLIFSSNNVFTFCLFAISSLFLCFPINKTSSPAAFRARAVVRPNLPSPKTAIFSNGLICSCSRISSAAARGSINTASSVRTLSGISTKFLIGIVTYSAIHPSFFQIPRVSLFGQCLSSPFLHHSHSPHPLFISPATRLPTQYLSSELTCSTMPINS